MIGEAPDACRLERPCSHAEGVATHAKPQKPTFFNTRLLRDRVHPRGQALQLSITYDTHCRYGKSIANRVRGGDLPRRGSWEPEASDIPISAARQGIEIIPAEEVGGKILQAIILNPSVERVTGKYVNEVNSVAVRMQYGDVSFLFPSLMDNEGFSNMAQNVKGA